MSVVRGKTNDSRPFLAVPFFALANRGNSIQEVWQYQEGKPGWTPPEKWGGNALPRIQALMRIILPTNFIC